VALGDAFQVAAVMKLVDMVSGPLKNIRGEMTNAEGGASSLSSRMRTLGTSMKPLAMGAGVVLGALASTAFATIETGKALGELASVGISDMEALESAATDFSNNWAGTNKAEFLAAAYDIKSGISSLSDEGVAEFTKMAALTGKATKSTTAEMTSLFATGYGIYKGMYEDLSDMEFAEVFGAGIAASVQAFKTTGSGMAQAISTLGSAASTSNVPLEEQLAILGMLQQTMTGGEAGTKYRSFMQAATGAAEKLGLQFTDTNNQLKSMPEILEIMRKKYGETLDDIEKADIKKAFGSDEAMGLITQLYDKVDTLSGSMESLKTSMVEGESFTAKMAATMNRDLGSVLQIARQRFGNLLETVGKVFIPVILLAASAVSKIATALQKFADTKLGATILGLTGILAAAVIAITGLALAIGSGAAAMPLLTAGLAPLKAALLGISWPVLAIIAAVGALYLAWKYNFGGIRDFMGLVGVALKAMSEKFKEATAGVTGAFLPAWESLKTALAPVGELFSYIKNELLGFKASAGNESDWVAIGSFFGNFVAAGVIALAHALGYLISFFGGIIHVLKVSYNEIQLFWERLVQAKNEIVALFDFNLFEAGAKLFSTLTEGIKSKVSGPIEAVKGALSGIRDMLPFSDAKVGPLSQLTASGRALTGTLGEGINLSAPDFASQFSKAIELPAVKMETAKADKGKSVTIRIENLNLEKVQNAEDFISQLQGLVMAYDS
jgi:TP901 family phage tail tape measure protein